MGDLAAQYKEMHARGHFKGHSLIKHAGTVEEIIKEHDAQSILDYGCGKAEGWNQLREHWKIEPTLYDPHVEEFSKKPGAKFDGVLCIDVLEHIEEKDLIPFLQDVAKFATKFIVFTICTRPAKKNLPDGRNCHVTVRPREWWTSLLEMVFAEEQVEIHVIYEGD